MRGAARGGLTDACFRDFDGYIYSVYMVYLELNGRYIEKCIKIGGMNCRILERYGFCGIA